MMTHPYVDVVSDALSLHISVMHWHNALAEAWSKTTSILASCRLHYTSPRHARPPLFAPSSRPAPARWWSATAWHEASWAPLKYSENLKQKLESYSEPCPSLPPVAILLADPCHWCLSPTVPSQRRGLLDRFSSSSPWSCGECGPSPHFSTAP